MKATILDLRYRMKDVMKAVERGETVTVLHRGKAKARLVPLTMQQASGRLRKHEAFGLWKDREDLRDVAKYLRNLRRPRDLRH